MSFRAPDITDNKKYQHIIDLPYNDVVPFVLDYLKKRSVITVFALFVSITGLLLLIIMRLNLGQQYPLITVLPYTMGGLILFPALLVIPHEFLHIIPYYIIGARDIRIGANLPGIKALKITMSAWLTLWPKICRSFSSHFSGSFWAYPPSPLATLLGI